MKIMKISALALVVAGGLAACGGSGSSGGSAAAVETRTFESSWINGAQYKTATQEGVTGKDCITVKPGCFDVRPGEQVTFTIGNLVLPPVTAAAGQTRITVRDVAQALPDGKDKGMDSLPARAIVAYMEALDEGTDAPGEDGKRIFQVRDVANKEALVTLRKLLDDAAADTIGGADPIDILQGKLSDYLSEAGESINPSDIKMDASLDTDLGKEEIAIAQETRGYEDGDQPQGFFSSDELALAKPMATKDLADTLWSVNFSDNGETGISSTYFKAGGTWQTAETQNDGEPPTLDAKWNVVNSVIVLTNSNGEGEDCIATAKTSNSITIKCLENTAGDSTSAVLTRVTDLAATLTSGGKWNFIFEKSLEEVGTITFGSGNSFSDEIFEIGTDNLVTKAKGTFEVNGLMFKLIPNEVDGEPISESDVADETSTCYFAGWKQNTLSSAVEDIAFRCIAEGASFGEDILLTKRADVQPLNNTPK